jgi:hypothetical protein
MDELTQSPGSNPPVEVIDASAAPPTSPFPNGMTQAGLKRVIAHTLREKGQKTIYVEEYARNMTYIEFLGIMLWRAVTEGRLVFADGTQHSVENFKDWLTLIKFTATHLDGSASNEPTVGSMNYFKVYVGFDPDKV